MVTSNLISTKTRTNLNTISEGLLQGSIWLALVMLIGIYLYEGKGLYGPFVQFAVAINLFVIALYDLISVPTFIGRAKGLLLIAIGIVYLVPAWAAIAPGHLGLS